MKIGLDGSGLWSASVMSADVCVTASTGYRLSNFFCNENISVVSETRSDYVLGIYNVRYL